MSEEQTPHSFGAADESPVTIPPVDEAWTLMQQKLDLKMPVIKHWYNGGGSVPGVVGIAGVAGIAIALAIWFQPGSSSHTHIAKSDRVITAPVTTDAPNTSPAGAQGSATTDATRPADSLGSATTDAPQISPGSGSASARVISSVPALNSAAPVHGSTPLSADPASATHSATTSSPASVRGLSSVRAPATHSSATHPTRNSSSVPAPAISSSYMTLSGSSPRRRLRQPTHRPHAFISHPSKNSKGQAMLEDGNPEVPENRPAEIPSGRAAWTNLGPSLAKTSTGLDNSFLPVADSLLKAIRNRPGGSVIGKSPGTHALNNKASAEKKNKPSLQRGPRQLSAGLSIGKNFAIAQQQSASYNINGKGNTLSDYIPAPYFRFYIGNRLYLETILRINSPQYTPSEVLEHSGGDTTRLPGYPSYLQYSTVTLKKLYYTDVPLSLHYRVFRNFWLGTGLQYSRLWGGVASEEIILHPSNGIGADIPISSGVIALKNNAHAYGKVAKSDWRVLLEADYNWRRFTLGLRYQQALKAYLPPVSAGGGGERNGSVGLGLYYDLWQRSRQK